MVDLDELEAVNPNFTYHYDKSTDELITARLCKVVQAVEKKYEVRLPIVYDAQDRTDFARVALPPPIFAEENPMVILVVSQFPFYSSIMFDWDLRPNVFEFILSVLQDAGFSYAPFSLFASQGHYDWRAFLPTEEDGRPFSTVSMSMKRPELWSSLFDYV